MSQLATILLTLMIAFPVAYLDRGQETSDQREARLSDTARAIDDATLKATCQGPWKTAKCQRYWTGHREDLAILLVTIGFWESRFALNVHQGKCKKWECDAELGPNGTIVHKARTPWQMQRTSFSEPEWDKMVGIDYEATFHAAYAAAKSLSPGYRKCGNVYGAISIYAGAGTCKWEDGRNRVAFYGRLRAKYRKLVQERLEQVPDDLRCFPLRPLYETEPPRLALNVQPFAHDLGQQFPLWQFSPESFLRYRQPVVDASLLGCSGGDPYLMRLVAGYALGSNQPEAPDFM